MRRKGCVWITSGLLLIAAALLMTGYNLRQSRQAGDESRKIVEHLDEIISAQPTEAAAQEQFTLPAPKQPDRQPGQLPSEEALPDYIRNPGMEMPVEMINGNAYIGVLELPTLGLELPVMSEWSYSKLKVAPCRYKGSAYSHNLIILAHNYSTHFGTLKDLGIGDPVTFTDADGNVFRYEVLELETLMPSAIEEMESGDWDLTLFTCTVGGQSRVTVRCVTQEE